jgi:hypothetical protein
MKIPVLGRTHSWPVVAAIASLAAAGCAAPPAPLRELYAELRPGAEEEDLRLVPFPLDAESREAYASVHPLGGEGSALLESLYETVGRPWAGQLIFPSVQGELREVSAVYLGHAAFAHEFRTVHHVRLMVVNRLDHDLHLPLESVVCDGQSGLELLTAVNDKIERVENTWYVPAGDSQVLHVFFVSRSVDRVLRFGWELRAPPTPEGAPAASGPWLFSTGLRRHFVLRDVPFDRLERVVLLGEELPPAREPPQPWAEPLLTPVPGPPAEGGEAGGEAGG